MSHCNLIQSINDDSFNDPELYEPDLHSERSDPVCCSAPALQAEKSSTLLPGKVSSAPKMIDNKTGDDRVGLEDLDVDQLCSLLDHCKLPVAQNAIREQCLSGHILASFVTSVQDLTDVGLKTLHARALFQLIREWKANGLPPSFVTDLSAPNNTKKNRLFDESEAAQNQLEAEKLLQEAEKALKNQLEDMKALQQRQVQEAAIADQRRRDEAAATESRQQHQLAEIRNLLREEADEARARAAGFQCSTGRCIQQGGHNWQRAGRQSRVDGLKGTPSTIYECVKCGTENKVFH